MPAPQRDEEREERIEMEIVVDCYNEHESRQGWCCYLEDKLTFPFEAKCIRERKGVPLKKGERVTVISLLDDDEDAEALSEMKVETKWQGRSLGVPLAVLTGVKVNEDTAEAIADWHYWVEQGRQF